MSEGNKWDDYLGFIVFATMFPALAVFFGIAITIFPYNANFDPFWKIIPPIVVSTGGVLLYIFYSFKLKSKTPNTFQAIIVEVIIWGSFVYGSLNPNWP